MTRDARKKLGLCYRCSRTLSPTSKHYCEYHQIQHNRLERERKARVREARRESRQLPELPGKAVMSFPEIARELGISPQRAQQIFDAAIKKLRFSPVLKQLYQDVSDR